jgi:hypothetical protein
MVTEKREHPLRRDYLLLSILAAPALLLLFTIGRYYGYYYDNKFFNLLTLELWEHFRLYLYLGSHYHVPSSIFSYLAYPLFLLLGPGDLPLELLAAIFHIATVYFSFRLGERFHGRPLGLLFALFAGLGPIHLIQVYTLPDLSFAIFLNISAVYYFLTGFKSHSIQLITAFRLFGRINIISQSPQVLNSFSRCFKIFPTHRLFGAEGRFLYFLVRRFG